jgi:hypothetical protein
MLEINGTCPHGRGAQRCCYLPREVFSGFFAFRLTTGAA